MDVLLTFTGFHDPFFQGLLDGEQQTGPILSLLSARPFDAVYLLSTPRTERHTKDTLEAIGRLHPTTCAVRTSVPLEDPTDYRQILAPLRSQAAEVQDKHPKARFFVAVASGTPQMHACWLLLVAGGELPARILHVRPPQFVSADAPIVSEVDLTDAAFPAVRFHPTAPPEAADGGRSPEAVIQQLGIIGDHPQIRKALEAAALLAPSDFPVLILGETGTGKEVLSRFVHLLSGRPQAAFHPVNCAALPQELVESILFGHKKGAFTGAVSDQKGKFEAADGGTLFLDEIGELPAAAQAKLLRVLQDGLVEPLGATKSKKVDVRLIAATNRDLAKEAGFGPRATMPPKWGRMRAWLRRPGSPSSSSARRSSWATRTRSTGVAWSAMYTFGGGTWRTVSSPSRFCLKTEGMAW